MKVILSIKPKYVERILSGEKKYEFRKVIFKKDVDEVIIYASSPVKKFVASFKIKKIIKDKPSKLWIKCNGESGVNEIEFFEYFQNKESGYAIKITDLQEFHVPVDPQSLLKGFIAPQSFQYCLYNLMVSI